MNIQSLIEQHKKAITMLEDIRYKEKAKETVQQSIDGVGGKNFPELKKQWQLTVDRLKVQIDEMKVDYRMFLNSIR